MKRSAPAINFGEFKRIRRSGQFSNVENLEATGHALSVITNLAKKPALSYDCCTQPHCIHHPENMNNDVDMEQNDVGTSSSASIPINNNEPSVVTTDPGASKSFYYIAADKAKLFYFLSENHLKQLTAVEMMNYGVKRLCYLKRDVVRFAIEVHGSLAHIRKISQYYYLKQTQYTEDAESWEELAVLLEQFALIEPYLFAVEYNDIAAFYPENLP